MPPKVSRIDIYTQERMIEMLPGMAAFMGKTGSEGLPIMPFITVLDDPADASTRTRVLQCRADPSFLAEHIERDKGYSALCAQVVEHNLRVAVDTLQPPYAYGLFRVFAAGGQVPMLQPRNE